MIETKHVIIPAYPPEYKVINPKKYKGKKFCLMNSGKMYSKRYKKWVSLYRGFKSDGATGAKDLYDSWSWWFHDGITDIPAFDDGTPCTAWQASMILKDILCAEGRKFRRYSWKWATFFGGSWNNKKKAGWF